MPVKNGTHYHNNCPPEVITTLENARLSYRSSSRYRLRLYYGDPATGLWWGDIEAGYIGRSGGPMKVPLLLWNKLSMDGSAILDHCIVRIEYANKRRGGILFDAIKEKEEDYNQPVRRNLEF